MRIISPCIFLFQEPPTNLDEFLLPKNLKHMPDMYVIGTQESGGDRGEWEVSENNFNTLLAINFNKKWN